ncbi:hypothetical protein EDI_067420 [Entamoeba dispar SAW760]|uniref:Uncharacterized protein n=1 Tax=Entamoeba dispar (strain ATCC PRA-260 / SAW760) TaxID=370354 RepID=B0EBF5_ENTDS|nr:uncharacterized protein EDI_067420 [Entamoeba dispar SAW760]EDR28136.1 hypothetical protein EDI_067420 [Entamoeba dispar SAW760]|eukprot:EDR28136.1 hypothetical protein EDI_067420 [Entamoeba dispar SAW760]
MQHQTALSKILLKRGPLLTAICNTVCTFLKIFNPIDINHEKNIEMIVSYCNAKEWTNEFIWWCYDYDFEFGYDVQFDNIFLSVLRVVLEKNTIQFTNEVQKIVMNLLYSKKKFNTQVIMTYDISTESCCETISLLTECFQTIKQTMIDKINLLKPIKPIIDSLYQYLHSKSQESNIKYIFRDILFLLISYSLKERCELGKDFDSDLSSEEWDKVGFIAEILISFHTNKQPFLNVIASCLYEELFINTLYDSFSVMESKSLSQLSFTEDDEIEQKIISLLQIYYCPISISLPTQMKHELGKIIHLPELIENISFDTKQSYYQFDQTIILNTKTLLTQLHELEEKRKELTTLKCQHEYKFDELYIKRKNNKGLKAKLIQLKQLNGMLPTRIESVFTESVKSESYSPTRDRSTSKTSSSSQSQLRILTNCCEDTHEIKQQPQVKSQQLFPVLSRSNPTTPSHKKSRKSSIVDAFKKFSKK